MIVAPGAAGIFEADPVGALGTVLAFPDRHALFDPIDEQAAGSKRLVAVGRAPNVDGLGLETVGVEFESKGVKVNDRLQTTHPRIDACDDIMGKIGRPKGLVSYDTIANQEAMAKGGSPLARIERAFVAHVAFVAANPGVPRVVFHELQYPGDSPVRSEVRAMIIGYRKQLAALFAQAKAAGELPADLDTALAPMLFIGAVQGLVIQSALAGDEAAMTRRARRLFPLLLHGYRGAVRS